MQKMRKYAKKALCIALSAAMLFTSTGMTVFAEESAQAEEMQQEFESEETSTDTAPVEEEITQEASVREETTEQESEEEDFVEEAGESTLTEKASEDKAVEEEDTSDRGTENTSSEDISMEETVSETDSTEEDAEETDAAENVSETEETQTAEADMETEEETESKIEESVHKLAFSDSDIANGEYKENGNDIIWVIDKDGKLTVEGTGDFASPEKDVSYRAPWFDHNSEIISAEIRVSGMTDASHMFDNCSNLTSVDLSGFDTSNVTNMTYMFSHCSSLTSVDLSGFDMSNVPKDAAMLYLCSNLSSIYTPYNIKSSFGLPAGHWYDTSGNEYTELPKNLSYSVLLTKDERPTAVSEHIEAVNEEGSSTEDSSSTEESGLTEESSTSDERPRITASGVLFPGKKADGYSAVYTGEKICPAMTVTYTYQDSSGKPKTQTLKLNADYTVTYRNNINAGENASVTIKGIGEYQGTVTKKFTITQKSISKAALSAVGDIKYGETPKVTVMDGTKELVQDIDYTLSWTEGNASTTTVSTLTVKAVESKSCNYTGEVGKKPTFNILGSNEENAVSIADARVEWKNPEKTYTYNGKAQKPAVVVTDKNGNKVASSYYKVIYKNNVNAGTNTAEAYAVGVTKNGAGYYGISEPLKFTIGQKSFGKVSASIKGTLPKFGTISDIKNAINEAVVVKDGKTVLSYEEDYTIDYGELKSFDDIKIGTPYEIKILPAGTDGNYTSDTKTLKIKFGQINLASKTAVVSLTITSVEEKKATLTYNGKTLEQDRDYTVASIIQEKGSELYTVKITAVKGSAYKGSLTFKGLQFKTLSKTPDMTLDKGMITGETGETVQLNAVIPSGVQFGTITWESSNESVATVTDKGLVSLVGSGMAVITARVSVDQHELTAQCQVVVKGKIEDEELADVTDYGAVPGDGKDDWEAIQGALDDSKSHMAYVPAGIYDIDLNEHNGIVMRKNYKLYMHKDAVLRAMKTDKTDCQVISVGSSSHKDDPDYYSNIEISGGTIVGELRATGKDGEGVMGIRVQYAKNIYIHDVTVKECRGDGIYVGGNGKGSTNICITGCTIEDNSRNCLGIVSVHNLYVDNCKISGAGNLFGGKAPRACILIEKNKGDDTCTDIVIKNSTIDNKEVCKSQSEAYAFGSSSARNEIHGDRLTVENCTFRGKVANYSTTNARFIHCTFDGEKILKKDTVVQD